MGVSHWEPEQRPGVPVSNRWYASVYFKEKTIAAGNGWKVVVEAPIRPLVEEISQQTMVLFEVIIALIVTVIGLSRVHAARYSLSVRQLVDVTRQLPERCSSGEEVVWPHSMSREMSGLIANFQVMAAAIHRDIKEMEHLNESLEQRVAERTQELREAIQFSEQVIQSAQEGIAVHDLELHYLAWNPFMETLSGITADRVLGRHPAEIFPHLIETGTIARLESVAAGGPPTSMDIQFRDAVSGKTKWVSELSAPLCNSKGVIIGAITTVRDISNRKRMEELARCALDNAIGANNTMKRLLRVIAHEFRTPLGLLTGCTDILDRYWDRLTPEKRSEQNGHIRRAARQLSKLLESVVAFNHLGTETPVERPLADIGGLCRTIAAEAEINWGAGRPLPFP
ncbi:PAS domain-containing protein [Geobacter sp. FeAm09]|uniref:PAS domain-containing protein n=1 Tax=Geobacter sp. FeAm09 TaxID=2597769 RepID=UPI00197A8ABC|nr:PAS domain-containing protein [Geobacter sp. FeAm09]